MQVINKSSPEQLQEAMIGLHITLGINDDIPDQDIGIIIGCPPQTEPPVMNRHFIGTLLTVYFPLICLEK